MPVIHHLLFSPFAIQMVLGCDLGHAHTLTHARVSICLHLDWLNPHSLSPSLSHSL